MENLTLWSILRSWSWEPAIVLGLLGAAGAYAYGFYDFRQRGLLPTMRQRGLIRLSQPWLYFGGLLAAALALLSPIDVLGDSLFAFHMGQHILLVMVVPPLLLLGLPAPFLRWSLFETRLRGVLHVLTDPLAAFALYNVNLWVWHLPALYQGALETDLLHALQHTLFLGTGMLFWWRVFDPTRGWYPLWGWQPARWVYLLVSAPPSYLLGSIFWASGSVIYPHYAQAPRLLALSALEDQRIAGMLMWLHSWMYVMAAMIALYLQYEPGKEQA